MTSAEREKLMRMRDKIRLGDYSILRPAQDQDLVAAAAAEVGLTSTALLDMWAHGAVNRHETGRRNHRADEVEDGQKCESCGGSGRCQSCHGTGRVSSDYDYDDEDLPDECPDPDNPNCPDFDDSDD